MSEFDRQQTRDFSKYDNLSTEELENILRMDFMLKDAEKALDEDVLLHISEVIAKRKKKEHTGNYKNVQAAWDSFLEDYAPFSGDGSARNDFDDDCFKEPAKDPVTISGREERRTAHRLIRSVAVLAATVATILVLSLTAYAFGYNFWGAIANWTKSAFGFEKDSRNSLSDVDSAQKIIPEELNELADMLSEHISPDRILPGYLPEGYTSIGVQCTEQSNRNILACMLENKGNILLLQYTVHFSDGFISEFQKNDIEPEIYEAGGEEHYIFTNMDSYNCAWTVDNLECGIMCVETREELIKIIDSIYGGNNG